MMVFTGHEALGLPQYLGIQCQSTFFESFLVG